SAARRAGAEGARSRSLRARPRPASRRALASVARPRPLMKLIEVPPREGLVWVRRGFQVFLRQPFGFASLFAACALVFLVLLRVPYVGEPILLVVAPVGSL